MRRLLIHLSLIVAALVVLSTALSAQTGKTPPLWCQEGGVQLIVQGLASTSYGQITIGTPTTPCTVTVYNTGTLTLATLTGVSGNPFTANADGSYGFTASTTQNYDIVETGITSCIPLVGGCSAGGTQTTTVTLSNVAVQGSGGGGGGGGFYQTVEANGTAATQRPTLNLIPGANVTVGCADNAGLLRTDCTLAATNQVGPGTISNYAGFATTTTVGNAPATFSGLNSIFQGSVSTIGVVNVGASPPTACGSALACIALNEASAAGTPTAGQDYMRADSTTHKIICSYNGGAEAPCGGISTGTGAPAPQIGDILVYNVNGDSAWDTANYSRRQQLIYFDNATGALQAIGQPSSPAQLGTVSRADTPPTLTDQVGGIYSATNVASTSTVIGGRCCESGNFAGGNLLAWYRWSFRFAAGNTTNVRYWMGLATYLNGGGGSEGTNVLGTTKYATDSPTSPTLGFRFSSTTDTHWQCVSALVSGTQTATDSGITPDTNPHLFEMTFDGTTLRCFIDRVAAGTVTTNLPPVTNDSTHGEPFWTGDNKNTATAISGTFYNMAWSVK